MADSPLYKLPAELLLHLFLPLTTPELLPLTLISHRIATVILRILHNRLVIATELQSHSLLLECYHPSAKLFELPYFCAYHGTDGLTGYDGSNDKTVTVGARLGQMRNMYSRFRPYQRELEAGGRRVVARPGDIPGSRTFPGNAQDKYEGETVKQTLSLEGHELFTQLVAQTNMVKIGPRHGLFTCFVEVEEGVVRVWKNWLEHMATRTADVQRVQHGDSNDGSNHTRVQAVGGDDKDILWISSSKNTGIRLNVVEKRFRRNAPILIRADEDAPVTYEIEYDELLIRTSHLLLTLEKSLIQEDNTSGKAVVFGSFG